MMGVLPSLGSVSRLEYVLQLPFSKKDLFQEGRITVFLLIHLSTVGPHCLFRRASYIYLDDIIINCPLPFLSVISFSSSFIHMYHFWTPCLLVLNGFRAKNSKL